MGNPEDFEARLCEITAIPDEDIIRKSSIPMDVYLQEADNLCKWCRPDKDALVGAGLDWRIVEDIPVRANVLREALARWVTLRLSRLDSGRLWKAKAKELLRVRNNLLHTFRFAYSRNPFVKGRIHAIAGSKSYAALIQDLSDLSRLGRNNPEELIAINFDMSALDDAIRMSSETAVIYAAVCIDRDNEAEKKIKDQAFTFLKLAVDEVYRFGQFVFSHDEARRMGYASAYLRNLRKKHPKNKRNTGAA